MLKFDRTEYWKSLGGIINCILLYSESHCTNQIITEHLKEIQLNSEICIFANSFWSPCPPQVIPPTKYTYYYGLGGIPFETVLSQSIECQYSIETSQVHTTLKHYHSL